MATGPINRNFFFDQVKGALFSGSLKQKQVDGLTALLDYWEEKHAKKDDRWLAYALGTAYHEVDKRMQPINEYGTTAYFMMMYDKTGARPNVAAQLGNTEVGDGAAFHGRGFVQLTGRKNYKDWGTRLGVNLVGDPKKALDLDISTAILFEGMRLGTFTGKKFSDYFDSNKEDWINARRIVNGLNKANLIAGHSKRFYAAISYTT
jgi:putative chitinase